MRRSSRSAPSCSKGVPLPVDLRGQGLGPPEGNRRDYRGSSLTVNVRPKLKIEVVVDDSEKDLVVETILKHARTATSATGRSSSSPSRRRSASAPARRARRSSRPTPTESRHRGSSVRDLHSRMLAALLAGQGLRRVSAAICAGARSLWSPRCARSSRADTAPVAPDQRRRLSRHSTSKRGGGSIPHSRMPSSIRSFTVSTTRTRA